MEGNNLHFHQHGASLVAQLVKNLPAIGRPGSIPGLGKSHGEGNGNLLQYSDLENSMDCIVHGVVELDMTERVSLKLSKLIYTYIQYLNRCIFKI